MCGFSTLLCIVDNSYLKRKKYSNMNLNITDFMRKFVLEIRNAERFVNSLDSTLSLEFNS